MPMGTINELTTGSQVASSQIWIDYHPDANASSDDGPESFVIRALDPNNPAGLLGSKARITKDSGPSSELAFASG